MRLIDKKELMELLDDMFSRYDGTPSVMEGFKYGLDAVISEVSVMPTIEAEPTKYGKWTITECFDVKDMTCSYCGWLYEYYAGMEEEWNYCPHCGARMDGVEE